jgi:hypothetical protein
MTLRHIVLMHFPDGPDPDYLAAMDAGVREMIADIPDVAAGSGGADTTGNCDNHHYAIVLDFPDRAAYERYRVHPVHQRFIADFMKGRAITKARLQYEIA